MGWAPLDRVLGPALVPQTRQNCSILRLPFSDAMTFPVETFRSVEKIGRILKVMNDGSSHNGYPVVEDYYPDHPDKVGAQCSMSQTRNQSYTPA